MELTREHARRLRSFDARHRLLAPGAPLLAWLAIWVSEVVVEGGPSGCTPADPCTDTSGAAMTAAVLALALAVLAGLPVVASALVVLVLARVSYDRVPDVVLAAVAVWSMVAFWDAQRRWSARRAFVDSIAERVTLPDAAARALRRRAWRSGALAAVLGAATGAAAWWGLHEAGRQRELERAAPVVDAVVVRSSDDEVVLRTGAREHAHVPYDGGDFAPGVTVPVYDLGGELRPVAEPYDPAEATFPAMVLGALAVVPVTRALWAAFAPGRLGDDAPALEMSATDGRVGTDLGPVPYGRPVLFLPYVAPPAERVVVAGEIEPGGWVVLLSDGEALASGTVWQSGRKRDTVRRTLQR